MKINIKKHFKTLCAYIDDEKISGKAVNDEKAYYAVLSFYSMLADISEVLNNKLYNNAEKLYQIKSIYEGSYYPE